jgi:hypothetical protein
MAYNLVIMIDLTLKPGNKLTADFPNTIVAKYGLKAKVYFMKNNKVATSKIALIKFPMVWYDKKGQIQMISTRYDLENGDKDMPECWLFGTKSELLKSL